MQKLFLWMICMVGLTIGCPMEPRREYRTAFKSPGDGNYRIQITGDPNKYVPGSIYTLSLLGSPTQQFSRFMIGVEPSDGGIAIPQRVGSFQLFPESLTTFNLRCINTVSEFDSSLKSEVQVMWTAPKEGSGCVTFRAMVMENVHTWYAEEGNLVKELCELPSVNRFTQNSNGSSECCACDDAKYKMVFEGIWSNITHPKDFPFSLWLTHFSDLIGGTHERNFSFWGEGQIASDGLQQVAEWGSVRGMEAELRASSRHLRTLIKVPGLWYPRVNSNATSTFKVDRKRHLLSLVSMLGPSPDWIVGVSKLNLCMKDCSWAENMVIDLFPYDAGTDSGISYMSRNSPTIPKEKIKRITTSYPEDPRSPFFSVDNEEMLPLAKLYLSREQIIPNSCENKNFIDDDSRSEEIINNIEDTQENSIPECMVTPYTEWSSCSVSCGKGLRMRTRVYLHKSKAEMMGCNQQLVSKEMCVVDPPVCPGEEEIEIESTEEICQTSPWGPWSECSATCGAGMAVRSRRFLNRMGRKKCPHINIMEKEKCMGPVCEGPADWQIQNDPMCPVTEWGDWSPCSVTCGSGMSIRTRFALYPVHLAFKCDSRVSLTEKRGCTASLADCSIDISTAKEICMLEKESGPCQGYFLRWHFDAEDGTCKEFVYGGCRGNRNNFNSQRECIESCSIISPVSNSLQRSNEPAPEICSLNPEFGNCQENNNRWYFNIKKTKCETFVYSGCGGNVNNFATEKECASNCSVSIGNSEDLCRMEKDPGPCRMPQLRWYYDDDHDNCQQFEYGGCRGNLNNFVTQEDCLEACTQNTRVRSTSNAERRPVHNYFEENARVDCMVTDWSVWSNCSTPCGRGTQERIRIIYVQPKNGGRACPSKLIRRRKCIGTQCE